MAAEVRVVAVCPEASACWLVAFVAPDTRTSLAPLSEAPKAERGSPLSFVEEGWSAAMTAIGIIWPPTRAAPAVTIAFLLPMVSFSEECTKVKACADLEPSGSQLKKTRKLERRQVIDNVMLLRST